MGDYMDDMKYEDMTPSEDYSRGHAAGRKGKEQEVDAAYHSGYKDGFEAGLEEAERRHRINKAHEEQEKRFKGGWLI